VPFQPAPASGGGWEMKLILQLLPGSDPSAARARLLPEWLTGGVTINQLPPPPAQSFTTTDHPVFAAIGERLRADHGAVTTGPFFLIATATDSRFLRPHGVPSYGFTPFPIFSTDTLHVDNVDERLGLPGYRRGVTTYEELLDQLAR
jgi:acetylornithine deacetylase/succinyl-diaminopimelate desuccinylase-like protein